MAKYLVTGAAGFIGSKVVELLVEAGEQVTGVDNLNDAYDVRLKLRRLERLSKLDDFAFHRADIRDRARVMALGASAGTWDAVINLAARAGVRASVEDPQIYLETNVTGTLHLLDLCRCLGVRKFVLASTSSLYGAANPTPYREDANTDRPLSPYAASKKAAESLCYSYGYLHGLDITVLRYFTVYGPGGRPDMSLFRFVQWIAEDRPVTVFGDGRQSRDFTYVDDIARGTIAALRLKGFNTINLGSDRPVVLADTIAIIERLLGRTARIEHRPAHAADVPATWADIGRARQLLKWAPVVSCEEGIARLVRWYLDNREWASRIATTEPAAAAAGSQ
jgi:nucleoside-diphosphate-sugar epimerase